tara:strand:+ start:832 stop:1434 length:603 start_codon:yes stop_codon:yes gene_type:complete
MAKTIKKEKMGIKLIVYLVRHGRKDLERFRKNKDKGEPCYLSNVGLRQAKCLAKRFSKEKIDEIFVSNFERCVQTGEPTSEVLGMKMKVDKGFGEINKEFRKTLWKKNGYGNNERKEISRIKKSWDKIIRGNGKIIVFAHGGTNRVIMSLVLGMPVWKLRFGINPAGVTEIRINENGEMGIRHSNDISHLPMSLRKIQSE